MDSTLQTTLQTELKQLFMQYHLSKPDAEALVNKLWPEIQEAVDFAAFVEQMSIAHNNSAAVIDPLEHLDAKTREAVIQKRLAGMDRQIREGLEQSQGKWAEDNG
ncbi:MAG: hypothetical protein IT324_14435 [Anaerolineae bacterium]|nr:hypothetical protein [Anaerolineae bacterium]